MEQDMTHQEDARDTIIEVRDLRFTYPKAAAETIRGIDFGIEEGEIFGFLGPSGAGKSTTQKVIIGILRGYDGEVSVLKTDLARHTGALYEHIGVSFELPNLYTKLTARENLSFFAAMYGGKTASPESLLEMVGLKDDIDTRVSDFSKGMKMRLNFVRALVNEPRLLFLDEPTGGQDPVNARRVKDIILEQKQKGTTVFLTTHDMHTARELCDRVAFIVDGRLAIIDSPRNLVLAHGKPRVAVEYRRGDGVKRDEFDLAGIGENQAFLNLLKEAPIETIHSEEATLEDVFIEVTGRRLA